MELERQTHAVARSLLAAKLPAAVGLSQAARERTVTGLLAAESERIERRQAIRLPRAIRLLSIAGVDA